MLFIPAKELQAPERAALYPSVPSAIGLSPCGRYLGLSGTTFGTTLYDFVAGARAATSGDAFGSAYFLDGPGVALVGRGSPGAGVRLEPGAGPALAPGPLRGGSHAACPDPADPAQEIVSHWPSGGWYRSRPRGRPNWAKIAAPRHSLAQWLRRDATHVVGANQIGQFSVLDRGREGGGVEPLFAAPSEVAAVDFAAGLVVYLTHNHMLGTHRIGTDPIGEPGRPFFPPGRPHVGALSLSPCGRRLALAHGRRLEFVSLYEVESPRKALGTFDWKLGEIGALCHSPDGARLAAAGTRGVMVWDAE